MTDLIYELPYYAVIFTSQRNEADEAYSAMADKMQALAGEQDGFLHAESVRDAGGLGVTVSYWRDTAAIARWKQQMEHLQAQQLGQEKWYAYYSVQVCKVERTYEFEAATDK